MEEVARVIARTSPPSLEYRRGWAADALRIAPLQSTAAVDVVRLYVQAPFQRQRIGRELLRRAESGAVEAGTRWLWLSAWCGNERALTFYASQGYADVGCIDHVIEGQRYENRVFVKPLPDSRAA
jgi:ribosomal protein S18 acetylase RimI-like enzyme